MNQQRNTVRVISGKEGRMCDRMKVNNTEKTGAKVGWERRRRRRGCAEVSEREEREAG